MWQLFTAVVAMVTVQLPWIHAKYDVHDQVIFDRHYNEALIGHVINTIPANRMDCNVACADTPGCRSVNIYKNSNGQEMCDLNKSSKTARPGSIVSKSGYEYDEITTMHSVDSPRDAAAASNFSTDWHKFNSSLFKLFKERMTWSQARNVCGSHQGDLVSIASQQEKDFINTTLLPTAPRGNATYDWQKVAAFWKLDGSDVEVTLHGEAVFKTVDGYKALYLDGNNTNYATTPSMNLRTRGFTIGAWVKLLTPASTGLIYGDWSSPYQFCVQVDERGNVTFKIKHESFVTLVSLSDSTLDFNVWVHVMAGWSANYRTVKIYINGKKKSEYVLSPNATGLGFQLTSHTSYDIGRDTNESSVFHGYIRELAVFRMQVPMRKENVIKRIGRWDTVDGVWIGLNDLSTENSFTNSDGSAMTYTYWADSEPNDFFALEDCVAICLDNEEHRWCDKTCGAELPFICRKKSPA